MRSVFQRQILPVLSLAALFACTSQAESQPPWWNSTTGLADIVLPGWAAVQLDGTTIRLGAERDYVWSDTLLPARLAVAGKKAAGPLRLIARANGETYVGTLDRLRVVEQRDTRITVRTQGRLVPGLDVSVDARVEYDGVAMLSITLTPSRPIEIDQLTFEAQVSGSESSRMLAFKPDTIHKRQKQVVFDPDYHGDFLNAVGFPDGERSFWLFADNAEGWIWNGATVTDVSQDTDKIIVAQHLIGHRFTIDKPMTFAINFLLTPVRELSNTARDGRVVRHITSREADLGRYQLWWTNAFAHQNLPYVDYPPGVREQLPAADLAAYHGAQGFRRTLDSARRLGIDRLPYFSAHVLSAIDPAFSKFADAWSVEPPYVMPPGSDPPFTLRRSKPWLSHRAQGYTNYLIERFDALLAEVSFEGLYFDQGSVIGSTNPSHGAWRDSNGVTRASTDILATREFYRRLATVFHEHGREGAIFVHNSRSPVAPAYTFVSSMVQGEEFVQDLIDLDYIGSISADAARSIFAPDQYGIGVTWLSELWSARVSGGRARGQSKAEWFASQRYQLAFRNFMTLALLHNTNPMSLAPIEMRASIFERLDEFGTVNSRFVGYWANDIGVSDPGAVKVSYYQKPGRTHALLIVGNLAKSVANDLVVDISPTLVESAAPIEYRISADSAWKRAPEGRLAVDVPGRDFRMVEVRRSGDAG